MTPNERRELVIERRKQKRAKARRFKRTLNTIAISVLLCSIMLLGLSLNEANKQNETLSNKVETLTENNKVVNANLINATGIINELNDVIDNQDAQLVSLSETNQSMVDELNQLRTRAELYNKYEYAILDENGKRTELTYEEIELGESLMLEKGYDPHLMMGTIMVESHGNPNAVNASSGATGYGQFLNSTAKWVWTKLMGNQDYHSDIRKDGESNIRMMVEYYDYLYNTVGNTFSVIKSYSGNETNEGAAGYLREINKHTNRVGVTVN